MWLAELTQSLGPRMTLQTRPTYLPYTTHLSLVCYVREKETSVFNMLQYSHVPVILA